MVAMNVWPTDGADGSVANEARWRKMGRLFAPSSVAAGIGGELKPTLAFPNLTIADGVCWIDGHFAELLGSQVLPVTANGLAVVRFDPAANTAELVYRDAVSIPAQNPTGIWELPVAGLAGSALVDRRALHHPVANGLSLLVKLAAPFTVPTDNAFVVVHFDTAVVSDGNWSGATWSWTAPRAGIIEASLIAQPAVTGGTPNPGGYIASVYVDAVEYRLGQSVAASSGAATFSGSVPIPIAAGQVVNARAYVSGAAGFVKSVAAGSQLAIRYIA